MKKTSTRDRLLKVAKIIRDSDENHPMTSDDIIYQLKARFEIDSERKAVGLDLQSLSENDVDIISCPYKRQGYFQGSHQFEAWELKVLVDAIAQARFLTPTVSSRLVDKLLSTSSPYIQETIKYATPTFHSPQAFAISTQNNIDKLLHAIDAGNKVSFQYCSIGANMQRVPRKNGRPYHVSPYALTWQQDFYYLICNYDGLDGFSYYRLDRIYNLRESSLPSRNPQEFAGHDWPTVMNEFVQSTIHHHGGKTKIILQLKVPLFMLDYLHDEFGGRILRTESLGHSLDVEFFHVYIETIENRGLYFLLLQYGENLEVLKPLSVRYTYLAKLQAMIARYENNF